MIQNNNIKILEVNQVNKYIKLLMNRDEILNNICVKGEISNFKNHISGHLYFTLKDNTSTLKCVMFKECAKKLNFEPKDGTKVIIFGNVTVFERDGQYQLYCTHMEPDGIGTLYLEFEKLKEKLEKEGLFDKAHKQKIPFLPKRIGVLTSKTGAVIRDIINVSTRRYPNVNILLKPVSVQGINSATEVVQGIETFNRLNNVDVIIIARGGGSLEELWSFNEEIVARVIYASKIPIISAVGHETDYTISDMVADLRAPTPSAAAELAVPALKELNWKLYTYKNKLINYLENSINLNKSKLKRLKQILGYFSPTNTIGQYSVFIDNNTKQLITNYKQLIDKKRDTLGNEIVKLNALNPLYILERGYTLSTDESGKTLTSVTELDVGKEININYKDGIAKCQVKAINLKIK